jgi:hypothetical protein
MPKNLFNMRPKRHKMPEIFKKAEKAMKAAIRQVMIDHKEKGLPMYVWRNEKLIRIPANRISLR